MNTNNIMNVLVLDWDQAGMNARRIADLLSAAFPQAAEETIQAAAWISVGDQSRDWAPHLVRIPDEATDFRVLAYGDEYLSSEYAVAVVDGKIVDCKVIPVSEAEHLLPSDLMGAARRLVETLQQWGVDEDDSDEDEDEDEEEDDSDSE